MPFCFAVQFLSPCRQPFLACCLHLRMVFLLLVPSWPTCTSLYPATLCCIIYPTSALLRFHQLIPCILTGTDNRISLLWSCALFQYDHTDAILRGMFPHQFSVWEFAGLDITQPVTDTLIRLPFPVQAVSATKPAVSSVGAQPKSNSGYASTTTASMTAGEAQYFGLKGQNKV